MASIILSFVGTQDPYSERTKEEGSIVSLAKHLLENSQEIKHVLLLYTQDLEPRANLTQEWLQEKLKLTSKIELIPVSEILSDDPIDILRATTAAKQALENAQRLAAKGDYLEMNFSSGTPTMKSTWTILQAAGYAPNGRVWQVRNPAEMKEGQERVFNADLTILKNEFDLKIIKQQLDEYNYSGALATITASMLDTPEIEALLQYGHSRLSFDFDRAKKAISDLKSDVTEEFHVQVDCLCNQDKISLLMEVYFTSIISNKNQHYCDFLISVAQFQENVLRFLISSGLKLECPKVNKEIDKFWHDLEQLHEGVIFKNLKNSSSKAISTEGFPNIPTMIRIVERSNKYDSVMLQNLASLKDYCEKRNAYIHKLQGVSQIDDVDTILNNLGDIIAKIGEIPDHNPYDRLNETILGLLAEQQ